MRFGDPIQEKNDFDVNFYKNIIKNDEVIQNVNEEIKGIIENENGIQENILDKSNSSNLQKSVFNTIKENYGNWLKNISANNTEDEKIREYISKLKDIQKDIPEIDNQESNKIINSLISLFNQGLNRKNQLLIKSVEDSIQENKNLFLEENDNNFKDYDQKIERFNEFLKKVSILNTNFFDKSIIKNIIDEANKIVKAKEKVAKIKKDKEDYENRYNQKIKILNQELNALNKKYVKLNLLNKENEISINNESVFEINNKKQLEDVLEKIENLKKEIKDFLKKIEGLKENKFFELNALKNINNLIDIYIKSIKERIDTLKKEESKTSEGKKEKEKEKSKTENNSKNENTNSEEKKENSKEEKQNSKEEEKKESKTSEVKEEEGKENIEEDWKKKYDTTTINVLFQQCLVSKIENGKEVFGVTDLNGNIIINVQYEKKDILTDDKNKKFSLSDKANDKNKKSNQENTKNNNENNTEESKTSEGKEEEGKEGQEQEKKEMTLEEKIEKAIGEKIQDCYDIHTQPNGDLAGRVQINGIWYPFAGGKVIKKIRGEKIEFCDNIHTQANGDLAGRVQINLIWYPFAGDKVIKEIGGEKIEHCFNIHTQANGDLAGTVRINGIFAVDKIIKSTEESKTSEGKEEEKKENKKEEDKKEEKKEGKKENSKEENKNSEGKKEEENEPKDTLYNKIKNKMRRGREIGGGFFSDLFKKETWKKINHDMWNMKKEKLENIKLENLNEENKKKLRFMGVNNSVIDWYGKQAGITKIGVSFAMTAAAIGTGVAFGGLGIASGAAIAGSLKYISRKILTHNSIYSRTLKEKMKEMENMNKEAKGNWENYTNSQSNKLRWFHITKYGIRDVSKLNEIEKIEKERIKEIGKIFSSNLNDKEKYNAIFKISDKEAKKKAKKAILISILLGAGTATVAGLIINHNIDEHHSTGTQNLNKDIFHKNTQNIFNQNRENLHDKYFHNTENNNPPQTPTSPTKSPALDISSEDKNLDNNQKESFDQNLNKDIFHKNTQNIFNQNRENLHDKYFHNTENNNPPQTPTSPTKSPALDISSEDKNLDNNQKESFDPKKSIVDYLHQHKEDASLAHRAELAKGYGIKDYKGTAEQNESLLKKLLNGDKPKNNLSDLNSNSTYIDELLDGKNIPKSSDLVDAKIDSNLSGNGNNIQGNPITKEAVNHALIQDKFNSEKLVKHFWGNKDVKDFILENQKDKGLDKLSEDNWSSIKSPVEEKVVIDGGKYPDQYQYLRKFKNGKSLADLKDKVKYIEIDAKDINELDSKANDLIKTGNLKNVLQMNKDSNSSPGGIWGIAKWFRGNLKRRIFFTTE